MIFFNLFTLLQMDRLQLTASTVTDGVCKYHTSNDVFRGAKCVQKMATGKSDDELLQHDNKMRIWTRSEKFRKVKFSMSGEQSTTRTPMTTSMLA